MQRDDSGQVVYPVWDFVRQKAGRRPTSHTLRAGTEVTLDPDVGLGGRWVFLRAIEHGKQVLIELRSTTGHPGEEPIRVPDTYIETVHRGRA